MDRRTGVGCQPEAAPGTAPPVPRPPRRLLLTLAPLALVLLASALIYASGIWRHLSLAELRDRREALLGFVRAHPVLALEIYMAAYAVLVAFSIPGALLMSLSGGYLFGVLTGTAAAVAGASTGATAMFLVARTTLGEALARRVARGSGLLSRLQAGARKHTVSTLLALRLMPAVPFTLVNLLAGLVRMKLGPYVVATVIGIAPSTLVYAWTGYGLHSVFRRNGAPDLRALVRPEVYAPLVALAVLGSAPLLWRLWSARRQGGPPRPAPVGEA